MPSVPLHSVVFWLRLVTVVQSALLLLAWGWSARRPETYSALRGYLAVNAIGGVLASVLLVFPQLSIGSEAMVYTALFWTAYAVSGLLIFLTAQQIFRDALSPVPGLRRLALLGYRWIAVVSVAVSVIPAIIPVFFRSQPLHVSVIQAMRCVSLLEFCLLAFVLLSAQTLGISFRSRIVGISLGFGVLASVDTVCFVVLLHTGGSLLPWILVRQAGSLLTVAIWLVYIIKPEPQRAIVEVPGHSQLRKWNEIAIALGKPVPHIALTPQQGPFFLQDVEQVVDRVLSRNAADRTGSH